MRLLSGSTASPIGWKKILSEETRPFWGCTQKEGLSGLARAPIKPLLLSRPTSKTLEIRRPSVGSATGKMCRLFTVNHYN